MKFFNAILLVLLLSACSAQPKAVFIIVDGVTPESLKNASTPNLDEIAGKTGYTSSYVGGVVGEASESPTVSAVGYNALLTGTWSNKHNVWTNAIENPNYDYWDIFRIAKHHDPTLRTALFSTWTDNRTRLIGNGLAEAGGNKLDYYADGFELDTERFPHDEDAHYIQAIDELVTNEAAAYIFQQGPDLSWVYLQYTDDVAHFHGDGPEMTAAVEWIDQQVGKIWSSIRNRQSTNNEDWLLIVTTDHGRDASGKEHGGQSERERSTWIVTNSHRLNERFYNDPPIVDILPSIVRHLGIDIPGDVQEQLDGASFID